MADFSHLKLDVRILKAIEENEWKIPTEIQERSIPNALKGMDILVRSKTGSGKTGIYILTILQKLLELSDDKYNTYQAIVFVPTNELCQQVFDHFTLISTHCSNLIKILNISTFQSKISKKDFPNNFNILIGTPTQFSKIIVSEKFTMDAVKIIIFDEADLLFNYGHGEILQEIASKIPPRVQTLIFSATLNDDTEKLCSLVLHDPLRILSQEDPLPDSSQLSQFTLKCENEDKFLILYSLIILKLIRGKTIIFVNSINVCYKIKLFLNSFSIKSSVLNGELPVNSRIHILNEFKSKKTDILIATDESVIAPKIKDENIEKKEKKKNSDFSASRGIDFQNVENIINFDFPENINSYIHRVGRAARANNIGTAISLVNPKEEKDAQILEEYLNEISEQTLMPFRFKIESVENFRYRVEDVVRSITKAEVVNIRRREIKNEMYNSKKISEHFKNKPEDKIALKHDVSVHKTIFNEHLKKIPEYLIPKSISSLVNSKLDKSDGYILNRRDSYMKNKFKKQKLNKDPLKCIKSKRS